MPKNAAYRIGTHKAQRPGKPLPTLGIRNCHDLKKRLVTPRYLLAFVCCDLTPTIMDAAERIKAAASFLLQSPPGEINGSLRFYWYSVLSS